MAGSKIGIVCVAGGRGKRFGGDKLAEFLGTTTVLESSLTALRCALPSSPVAVVVPAERMSFWRDRLQGTWADTHCIEGGVRRQDSVKRGVEAIADNEIEIVVIHDGARPLVNPEDIRAAVTGLGVADGCILGQSAADTVKRVNSRGEVLETIDRQTIVLAQTPQVFRVPSLSRAWEVGDFEKEWTDEGALLESLGMRVGTVIARHANPKLTTEGDLALLKALEAGRP